ncbi:MAG: hypothetical protein IPJ75_00140 [Ignavibacteriales bacterium]|nr:hypothetical protein [Ignavibacteriales bacterium]
MNENDIKKEWQSLNNGMEREPELKLPNVDKNSTQNVSSLISSMKPLKLFTVILGILWAGGGGYLLANIYINLFEFSNKFFLYSATAQVILTAVAVILYSHQLFTIYTIDMTEPVIKTQIKLAKLKSSTLWVIRVMFLQLPLWTIFYWNEEMINDWNLLQWVIQGGVTLAFTMVSLWLFFNVKYENRDKKWFQLLFGDSEWNPIIKSIDLLKETEEYKEQ